MKLDKTSLLERPKRDYSFEINVIQLFKMQVKVLFFILV